MYRLLGAILAVASTANAGQLFFGAYPNAVLVFDEEQGQVVDRITLETGLPRNLQISGDRTKIYAVTNDHSGIEVIDIATHKVLRHFVLDNGNTRYRFNGGVPDPEGKFLYAILTEMVKKVDRFEIGKPKYAVIDLEQGKIVKTFDVAKEDESAVAGGGRNSRLSISPDGKYLYQFRDEVVVMNSSDFSVVDRMELEKPELPGMEAIGFGGELDSISETSQRVTLFNSSDPVVHKRMFGIARFDLNSRDVDFTPIGPAPEAMSGLQVAPDEQTAYAVVSNGTLGNKRCEFWAFELKTNQITGTQEFSVPVALQLWDVGRRQEAVHLRRGLRIRGLRRGDAPIREDLGHE